MMVVCMQYSRDSVRRVQCVGLLGGMFLVLLASSCKLDRPPASSKVVPHCESGVPTAELPSPPDLRGSTRVELRYLPSTIEYFFPSARELRLLNDGEKRYLKSVKSVSIDDRVRLDALAGDVAQVIYDGQVAESPRVYDAIEVVCYRGRDELTSFIARWDDLMVASGEHFTTRGKGLPSIMQAPVPGVGHLALRVRCAHNLWFLYHGLRRYFESNGEYPRPDRWCDALLQAYSMSYTQEQIKSRFVCPAAEPGESHYAINPHCTPESPPDTVLLFETKPGWNQHGGPESFVLDHHDPEGGCVLLNDGDRKGIRLPTVLFVRTRQEMEKLRWDIGD